MPLHVTDTPHRLELRMAGAILVEVPVFTLLQQVLAATVSRELVSHKAEEGEERGVAAQKEGKEKKEKNEKT